MVRKQLRGANLPQLHSTNYLSTDVMDANYEENDENYTVCFYPRLTPTCDTKHRRARGFGELGTFYLTHPQNEKTVYAKSSQQ